MKMMQRMLALLLTGLLLVGLMPTQALAAQTEPTLPDVKTEEETVAEEPKLVYVKDLGYELGDGFYAKLVMTVDETQEKQELDDMEQGLTLSVTEDGKLKLEVKEFNFPDTISHKDKAYLFEDFTCEEAKTVTETGYKSGQDKPCTLSVTLTRDPKEHSGGQANCVELAKCEFCGKEYGTANDAHDFVTWANDGVSHWQICSRNEAHISQKMGLCSGGEATCAAKAVCTTCGQPYGETLSHNLAYENEQESNEITEYCTNADCSHRKHAVLTADAESFTYTGSAITPYTVKCDEGWLGETPTVTYENNLNVGTATATLAIGDVKDYYRFEITPASLDDAEITLEYDSIPYDGENHRPGYTVTMEGIGELEEGRDYTAVFQEVMKREDGVPTKWFGDGKTDCGECIDVGYYSLIIQGVEGGNFTASGPFSAAAHFAITKAEPAVTAPVAKELTYTGQAQELVAAGSCELGTLVYSLAENGEYTETIPTGTDAGTYTVWYKALVPETEENYQSSQPASIEVTIAGVAPEWTAPTANAGLIYNGAAQALITAGSSEHGPMEYALGENSQTAPAEGWSGEIPTGVNAGTYHVWYLVRGSGNYADSTPACVEVTVGKADPVFSAPTANTGLVYNGEDQSLLLVSVSDGAYAGCKPQFALGENAQTAPTTGWSNTIPNGKDAKEYFVWWKAVGDENHSDTAPAAISVKIGRLTVTEDAAITSQQIIWDGTEKTAALTSVKMNGLDVTYQLTGNKATDVGVHKMKLKATGNFQGELELEFYILPDEDILKGITNANVTSANQEAIDKAQEMVKEADTSGFPEEIKAAVDADLKTIGDNADALEERLEDAADAASTTNITKAKAITAAKAKDTDKKVLTDAKEDLEDALETYGTNYTAKEREAMEDEIERLEDIIADITAAEDTIEAIDALSENSTKAKVEAAQAMYDKLTAAQKKIVDNSTDGKLDGMQGLVGNYKVTSGDGRRWSKKSSGVLSFTCNGPLNKFTGIRVDGKAVLSKHYTYKEGSTIVTLKTTYLETLKLGNHTITFRYEDGEASATFTIQKEAVTPSTGDQFNIGLWAGIGGASVVALVVLLIIMKKKMK